jgi:predicted DNA-binding WGR domain protein
MKAVTLERIDPAQNMSRFYKIDVQPTLFGEWALIREWGRIGRGGTVRSTSFPTAAEAEAAGLKQQLTKVRRGYAPFGSQHEAKK